MKKFSNSLFIYSKALHYYVHCLQVTILLYVQTNVGLEKYYEKIFFILIIMQYNIFYLGLASHNLLQYRTTMFSAVYIEVLFQ